MAITFENIQEANKVIKTMPIKRWDKKAGKEISKDYAVVNERVKAFRMLYPTGAIVTDLLNDDGERCVFKATVFDDTGKVLGTGTAFELKNASNINNASYIENCETSAVGRALAMCGIGIDVSIASYEEVANAKLNQKEEEMQPLPQIKEDKPKKATAKKEAAPKQEEQEMTAEQAQKQGAYPSREEMIKIAYEHYPKGSSPHQKLLASFGVNELEKASTAQLMAVYNKYANK